MQEYHLHSSSLTLKIKREMLHEILKENVAFVWMLHSAIQLLIEIPNDRHRSIMMLSSDPL